MRRYDEATGTSSWCVQHRPNAGGACGDLAADLCPNTCGLCHGPRTLTGPGCMDMVGAASGIDSTGGAFIDLEGASPACRHFYVKGGHDLIGSGWCSPPGYTRGGQRRELATGCIFGL